MIDSNNIIYFIKEYFAIIFYLFIISKIVFRVIQRKRKRKRKRKKKSRKGGGILMDIWRVLLCIITFGLSCNFWKKSPNRYYRFGSSDSDDSYDSDDSSDSDIYYSDEETEKLYEKLSTVRRDFVLLPVAKKRKANFRK